MKTYEAMRQVEPDFFVHCGDTIYADSPILPAVQLEDGTTWRNRVTEETQKVAETLQEFRARYLYNLLDDNVRRFSSEVPQVWQWDDHEVLNNWSDSRDLSADSRYAVKDVRLLARRAATAFLEYSPIRRPDARESGRIYRRIARGPLLDVFVLDQRSYRGPNSYNRQTRPGLETTFMGARQLEWLKRELAGSNALWKVVAADMPIGLLVPDGRDDRHREMFDAVANGDGPVLGREFEIAELLSFIKGRRIRNVFWVTADVHYTAAHFYDPLKSRYHDFDPFWEFVSGPLNAGTFGPNALDDTFGPQVIFQRTSPRPNAPPSAGYQFFGQVDVDGRTGEMTVTLKDVSGAALFAKSLGPHDA
jgi:alkaline phosphatase D